MRLKTGFLAAAVIFGLTDVHSASAHGGQGHGYYVPHSFAGHQYYIPYNQAPRYKAYTPAYRTGTYIERTRTTIIIRDYTRYYLPRPAYGYVYIRSGYDVYLCRPYNGRYLVTTVYTGVF
ncbi:MAG: hypothetical protein CMK09_00550 [Ponticaulis sp.]|nr:hypothetical protein [Ponticaulis sp.]|tara:strand:- start:13505 stop:13864 length:360 start_codon:yes stop_codon:yes gene_type:complete